MRRLWGGKFRLDSRPYVRYSFSILGNSPPSFDFAEALTRMKAGEQVARLCWKNDGRRVFIWRMNNGRGFVRLSQYHGHMVEWQAHDDDLLADDWIVHDGKRRV